MSDNKFIKRLKGEQTAKSVLEIKNESAKTSFANMPQGTSNAIDVFSDHRGNATAVLNGTTNWKVSNSELLLADTVSGDGQDFTSTYTVIGTGLWVNASYTFPSTGDPRHPVAMVFNPSTKWVLKLCGDSLIVDGGSTVDFTMLVKIGTSNVYSKNFTIRESAGQFSKEFIIDFGEANSNIVKAGGLSTLTVQLLCGTANASARIYNGMTVLTCLQRKVDASAVSNSSANVEDVLDGNIIPSDYFSNPEFIDQVEDGEDAYAVFTRDGDDVNLSGWTPKEEIATKSELTAHIDDKNNPHEVTKTQVGLGNVDNTSDLNKPISTATQTALNAIQTQIDGKQPKSASAYNMGNSSGSWTAMSTAQQDALNSGATTTNITQIGTNTTTIGNHIADTNNPHSVTKAQVGLGNVDNTSDLDKPISTATQTALNGKQDTISDLATIRSNAQAGKSASDTIATYGDVVTHNASEFASSTNRINGAPLSNTTSNFYGVSNTAAATVQKEVSIPSVTTLDIGTIIIVQPTVTSTVANSTLKLNDFPAYPMRYNSAAITTSTDSVVWSASFPSIWVFDGTYWVFAGHGLDSNTTYTLNYSVDAGQYTAGSGTYAITRYSILAQKAGGTWEKITATNANYSTGTSKSVNTSGFILNQLRYYGTTTTVASGVKVATNVMYEKAASVDMRYSTNCGATTTWALGDYIYLVGTIGADGLFYLDTTTWWSNALPTTNDGKLYIRLGLSLTAAGYTMSFFDDRPIFYHDGTGIKEYKVADNKQDVISDLATIRSGASAGATAVQPGDLATVATSGAYSDLTGKPTIPTTLAALTGDVSISSPASGEHLVYDGSKWKNTASSASVSWGGITGTLSNQTDLQNALNAKQGSLTAGDGIDITGNVISFDGIDCGTLS